MADKSKVYFTDLRVRLEDGLLKKLDRLIRAAGMETIDFKNKFAAIKIHFGEPGNLAFLRPNFSKVVADLVKEKGGRPFPRFYSFSKRQRMMFSASPTIP